MTKKLNIYLLIGLTKESAHWNEEFIAELQKKLNPKKIVKFDIPGTGQFISQNSPASIQEIAAKMHENYADEFKSNDHRLLVAISLGGMIGIEWMNQFPKDFHSSVVINSSLNGLSPVWKRVQPLAMVNFIKIFLTKEPAKKEELILKLCSNDKTMFEKIHPNWVEIGKTRPVTPANMAKQTLAGAKYKAGKLPEIPHLIIASKFDRLAHYSCSEVLHQQWGGEFQLFTDPKIGHAFHVDGAKELSDSISNWYNKNFSQLANKQ